MWRRDVIVANVNRQRAAVDIAAKIWMLLKRFELGAKQKRLAGPSVIKRLFARAVARQIQSLLGAVPQSEREHAVEFLDRASTPQRAIAASIISVSEWPRMFRRVLEFLAQRFEIIDFAIEVMT